MSKLDRILGSFKKNAIKAIAQLEELKESNQVKINGNMETISSLSKINNELGTEASSAEREAVDIKNLLNLE